MGFVMIAQPGPFCTTQPVCVQTRIIRIVTIVLLVTNLAQTVTEGLIRTVLSVLQAT